MSEEPNKMRANNREKIKARPDKPNKMVATPKNGTLQHDFFQTLCVQKGVELNK